MNEKIAVCPENKPEKKRLRGMRKKRFERRVFTLIILALMAVVIIAPAVFYYYNTPPLGDPEAKVTSVFYTGACLACRDFVLDSYVPWLEANGVPPIKLKNINGPDSKNYMAEKELFRKHYKVPKPFEQPIEIFIVSDITTILIGDAPRGLVDALLSPQNQTRISNSTNWLLYYQKDYMEPKSGYTLWGFQGEPRTYNLTAPIGDYIMYFETQGKGLPVPDEYKFRERSEFDWGFLLLVTWSAILDGINPCAIAILIFFITFLYSGRSSRSRVAMMGSTYIMSIYTIYFLIGLGLFAVMTSVETGLFIITIGSIVMIVLGFISLRDYLFPSLPLSLEVPYSVRKQVTGWLEKVTLPATAVIGLLIGAYTFPCSGAIYVVIVSMLAVKVNFATGLIYLFYYNFCFVMPLIIILIGGSNKAVARRLKEWQYMSNKRLRAFSGVVMIALGLIILVWFVMYRLPEM
jgi:cytochrome c biogenesis protein CcdA